MNLHAILALVFVTLASSATAAAPADEGAERAGILQLTDGSMLHGSLHGISGSDGLSWEHPAARDYLSFTLSNIALVRFEHAEMGASNATPTCRFQFKNGDELAGNIISIQDQQVRFQSWFGDALQARVPSLEAILFSSRGYKLLYEGPTGTNGWRIGRNVRSWEYRDGAFVANGADLLGRDFGLSGSSTLEFDLAWSGAFSLSITLYAQAIDRFDYSSSAYLVYLGSGVLSVQRVQAGAGAVMLGQAQLPKMLRRNKMHFEIRCNKEDATISLFADGEFIQRWKDNNQGGFVGKGGGIVFFSQVEPRSLKISNIRVAEWDGRFEPDALTNAPPELDAVFLANRDKVFGKLVGLADARVTVEVKQNKLDIPLERVTQIRFARNATPTNALPEEVRALFPGGESVVFKLEHWSSNEVKGVSRTLGPLAFHPRHIRQLQFNLDEALDPDEAEESLDTEFMEAE